MHSFQLCLLIVSIWTSVKLQERLCEERKCSSSIFSLLLLDEQALKVCLHPVATRVCSVASIDPLCVYCVQLLLRFEMTFQTCHVEIDGVLTPFPP